MKFYPRLHWLRGLLSVSVVSSHISHMVVSSTSGPLLRCGIAAVPVFFVLSGFVMYKVTSESPEGAGPALGFLGKRLLRIFPAYWFFLALTLLLVLFHGDTWEGAASPSRNWLAGWTLLTNRSSVSLPIGVAWSLVYEMIFYYVLCSFVWNRRIGVVLLAIYFAWSMALEHLTAIHVCGFYPIDGLFLSGLILGAIDQYRPAILMRMIPALFVGLAAALLFIIYDISLRNWVVYLSAIPIVAGILGLEHARPARSDGWPRRIMQFLGTISFSLYVGHTLTQSLLLFLVGPPTLATSALFVAVPILVSFGSFLLIEKPAMNLGRWLDVRFFSRRRSNTTPQAAELKLDQPNTKGALL